MKERLPHKGNPFKGGVSGEIWNLRGQHKWGGGEEITHSVGAKWQLPMEKGLTCSHLPTVSGGRRCAVGLGVEAWAVL